MSIPRYGTVAAVLCVNDDGRYVLFTDHEAEVERVRAEEREECAKLAEDYFQDRRDAAICGNVIAGAIRDRGDVRPGS